MDEHSAFCSRLCADHCEYAQHCHLTPVEGLEPEECIMYWHLEDLAHDAETLCDNREEEYL